MNIGKSFQQVLCEMLQTSLVGGAKQLPLPNVIVNKFDSPYMRRRLSCHKRR